jgi:uncharacterized protein YfaS (alpha-2-macroglobulin family)
LVDEGDYASRSVSLEAPKDLPDGYHVLVASADEDFSLTDNVVSVAGVHITPLALTVVERTDGGLEGHVVDAVTGAPLAGVEVGAWSMDEKQVLSGKTKTDETGYFRFQKRKSSQFLVIANRGLQRAVTRLYAGNRRLHKESDRSMAVFFTDRAIYRPGQTIHFKGIWYSRNHSDAKYELLKKTEGTVLFRDPNRKEIAKLKIITNERGSFSGSFTAPSGSVLGRFSISLAQEMGPRPSGWRNISGRSFSRKSMPPRRLLLWVRKSQ